MSKNNKFNPNKGETIMANNSNSNTSSATSAVSSGISFKAEQLVKGEVKQEVKPSEMKPATTATKAAAVSVNVAKLNKLLADYEAAVSKMKLEGNGKFPSMDIMISICEYLNRVNDPAVFDAFFRYFQRHQNDIMYHETALCGIHTIQNKMVKTRVSATHACYTELARVRSLRSGSFKFSINAMKVMNISEAQGKWIIAKAQTRN